MGKNVDSFHRKIDYLRISITDWCNLRCIYCRPHGKWKKLPHSEVLTYEEIIRISRIASGLGITKIRVTGGEPLLRRNIIYLCENLSRIETLESLTMTTNGVLLKHFASELYKAGVHRLNISLDTLQPGKYRHITGKNMFQKVIDGIEEALLVGFYPVKINVVAMRGINDDEIGDLAGLTFRYPVHVRFIELMPFSGEKADPSSRFISSDEILGILKKVAELRPASSTNANGPATHFRFKGALGKVGLISPLSHHFCPACNRLRLTADGKLRACLFSDSETDIKTPLRSGASDKELEEILLQAILNKPERHSLDDYCRESLSHRPMVAIGG